MSVQFGFELNERAKKFFPSPIDVRGFPRLSEARKIVLADCLNSYFGQKTPLAFADSGKSPSHLAKFDGFKERGIGTREEFISNSWLYDAEEIDSPEKLEEYFLSQWDKSLSELFVSPEKAVHSKGALFGSFLSYAVKVLEEEGLARKDEPLSLPRCVSCGRVKEGRFREKRTLFLCFSFQDSEILAEASQPEEVFSSSALLLDPAKTYSKLRVKGLKRPLLLEREDARKISAHLLGRCEILLEFLGKEMIGSGVRNSLTGEALPILPGVGRIRVLSPGTRKGDLEKLTELSSSKGVLENFSLSSRRIEEIQVKFPRKGGLFSEICGEYAFLPLKGGRRTLLSTLLSKEMAVILPETADKCPCGGILLFSPSKAPIALDFSLERWMRKKKLAGIPENWSSKTRPLAEEELLALYPLLASLPEKEFPPIVFDYVLGIEKNFNLAWKASGIKKEELLNAREGARDFLSRGVVVSDPENSGDFRLLSLPFLPPEDFLREDSLQVGRTVPDAFLPELVRKFGGDSLRLFLLLGNSGFSETHLSRLKQELILIEKLLPVEISALPEGEEDAPFEELENYLLDEYEELASRVKERMENLDVRGALFGILPTIRNSLSWYFRRGGRNRRAAREFHSSCILLLKPFLPGPASRLQLQRVSEKRAERASGKCRKQESFLKRVLADSLAIIRTLGKKPVKLEIFLAENWKFDALRILAEKEEISLSKGEKELVSKLFASWGRKPGQGIHLEFSGLSLEEERAALFSSLDFLSKELGLERIELVDSEQALNGGSLERRKKAEKSRPGKPGLLFS